MALADFINSETQEIRPIEQSVYDGWVANNNPKALVWSPYTQPAPEPPAPPTVPWAISNADLRRRLAVSGINPHLITDYLNSLPDGVAKWTAIADWEYANYFERSDTLIDQLAPAFGLTSADVDAMFLACEAYPHFNN